MEKVRVGIIGCGGIANGKHLPALKNLSEKGRVELVAFCDIIEERAQKSRQRVRRSRRQSLHRLQRAVKG